MKSVFSALIAILFFLCVSESSAQRDQLQQQVFTETIKHPFPTVWKAIHRLLDEMALRIESEKKTNDNAEGLFKGNIRTEFYIFAEGEDSTYDVLERYGVTPTIRAGRWVSGRIQYKIILKENKDETTDMKLTGDLSGFEGYVTNAVHFWNSNGILEKDFVARILKKVEDVAKEE